MNACLRDSCEAPLPDGRYVYIGQGTLRVDSNPPVGITQLSAGAYAGLEAVMDQEALRGGGPPARVECGVQIGAMTQSLPDRQGGYLAPVSREWAEPAGMPVFWELTRPLSHP